MAFAPPPASPSPCRPLTVSPPPLHPSLSRLLTMPNGERIQVDNNINFIFECHSLQFASSATVSRCGMISDQSEEAGETWGRHGDGMGEA